MEPIPSTSQSENITNIQDGHSSTEAPKRDLPSDQTSALETENIHLDSEVLEILGTDPTSVRSAGVFQHWVTTGINKELRKELVST